MSDSESDFYYSSEENDDNNNEITLNGEILRDPLQLEY